MAHLVRYDPFRELAALQNEMSRFMGGVFGGAGADRERGWVPALDVWETDGEVVYAFDLPGVPEEKISVEFEDGAITVSAEREREQKSAEGGFYRFERHFGKFERSISLPAGVGESDIKAHYENGVLELRVAKPAQPQPRRIPVGSGENVPIEGSAKEKK